MQKLACELFKRRKKVALFSPGDSRVDPGAGVAGARFSDGRNRGRRQPALQLQLRADEPDVPRQLQVRRQRGHRRHQQQQEVERQGPAPVQVRRRLRQQLRAQIAPQPRPPQGDRGDDRRRHPQGLRHVRR